MENVSAIDDVILSVYNIADDNAALGLAWGLTTYDAIKSIQNPFVSRMLSTQLKKKTKKKRKIDF